MDGDIIIIAIILIITVVIIIIIITAFVALSDFLAMESIPFYLDTCLKLWFGWLLFFGVTEKLIYASFLWWEDFIMVANHKQEIRKDLGVKIQRRLHINRNKVCLHNVPLKRRCAFVNYWFHILSLALCQILWEIISFSGDSIKWEQAYVAEL